MAKRYTEYSIEGQLTITDGLSPYTFPASAGVAGEVLTMGPGAGEVSWLPGGGGGSQNLASVLSIGNVTGGTDIEVTGADSLVLNTNTIYLNTSGDVNSAISGHGTGVTIAGNAAVVVSTVAGLGGLLALKSTVSDVALTLQDTSTSGSVVLNASAGTVKFLDGLFHAGTIIWPVMTAATRDWNLPDEDGTILVGPQFNTLVANPTVGEDGYAITWNDGGGEYTLSPAGGGSQDLQSVMNIGSVAAVADVIDISTVGLPAALHDIILNSSNDIDIDAVKLISIETTGSLGQILVTSNNNIILTGRTDIDLATTTGRIQLLADTEVDMRSITNDIDIDSARDIILDAGRNVIIPFLDTGKTPDLGDLLAAKDTSGKLEWVKPSPIDEICGYPIACTSPGPVDGDTLVYNNSSGFWELVPTSGTDTNIANTDLTLDANRTTDLDTFTLGFISGSVTADPKIGIGTATPTGTLELSTQSISNNVTFELSELGTTLWYIETDFATANKQVNFKAGTHNFMTFEVAGTSNKRIGIGTTQPKSNVHMSGSGIISSYTDETSLEITNSTTSGIGNIDNIAALRFSQTGSELLSGMIISGREGDYTAGNEDGYLAFAVGKDTGGGAVLTEWLHIESSGDTTFSTWKIVGNDLMPMNEPANIGSPGSPANRVDTIYMDSVIDYATDLKFEENGTDRIILNSGGDIELGIDGASTAIKIISTDGEIAVGNVSTMTVPAAAMHIYSHGSGSGKSLYIENNVGADVLSIEDGGDIIFGNLMDSYTFPIARAGVGEVLTDVLGNGVLSWQTAGGGAINTIYTANDALTGDRVVNCDNFQMNFNNTQGMQITGDGSPLNDTIHDIRNNGGQSIIAVSESNKSVLVNGGPSTGLTYDASTVFQIDSTSQGFLVPRMTTVERDLINSGTFATGLTVYNLTTNTLQYYDSTSWIDAGGGSQDLQDVMDAGSLATGLLTAVEIETTGTFDISGDSVEIASSVGSIAIPAMTDLSLQSGGGGTGDVTIGAATDLIIGSGNMGTAALGDVLTAFSAAGDLRWSAPTGYGIYKGSGSLSVASTVVTMGTNDIQFSGTTGIFKLGVSDFWYDSSNGKIGMGMLPSGNNTLSVFQGAGAGTSETGIFGLSQGAHIGQNRGIRGDSGGSTLINIGVEGNAGGTSGAGLVTAKNIGVRAYSTGTLADNYGVYALTTSPNPGNDNIAGYFEATNSGLGGSAFAIKTIGDIMLEHNSGVAGKLHFQEPSGTGDSTTFSAQAQPAQIDYELPAVRATAAGDVLSNKGTLGPQELEWKSSSNLPIRSLAIAGSFDVQDYAINCTGAASFTVDLPIAASISGKIYVLKNSGTGTVVLAAAGAELIDGEATVTLDVQYQIIMIQSDGSNWIVIPKRIPSITEDSTDITITKNSKVSSAQSYNEIHAVSIASAAENVDWDDGNNQTIDLQGVGGAGPLVLTFLNEQPGATYFLKIIQSDVPTTITWPGGVMWPGGTEITLSTGTDEIDTVVMFCDGTASYLANFANNYS